MDTCTNYKLRRWDLFCRVVDNFGDIGVCWRLACDLAANHGRDVRLWVDDWAAFMRLCPAARTACPDDGEYVVDGVRVRHWTPAFATTEAADVVIEAFACELPPDYLMAMTRRSPSPIWINLEYLSAEAWVEDCHGLASPHPRLPLTKHFFFPGFGARSGGLLREPGLLAARDAFQADAAARAGWLAARGVEVVPETLLISLFAYEQAALPALAEVWATGAQAIRLLVPEGRVVGDVAHAFGRTQLAVGDKVTRGNLSATALPFSAQSDYDRLLWACDVNFVRGEDSFVRAQWAGRPFVWHAYPQQDAAHRVKLDAFLDRYTRGSARAEAAALKSFWLAWNGFADGGTTAAAAAWPALARALPALRGHAQRWSAMLAQTRDLSSQLFEFCVRIAAEKG